MEKPGVLQRQFLFTAIIWWAVICIIYTTLLVVLLRSYHLSSFEITVDAAVSNLLLSGCCLIIFNNMRYYLPRHEKYWYVVVISLGLGAISVAADRLFLWLIFINDTQYREASASSSGMRFGISCLLIACMSILSLLWYTQQEHKKTIEHKTDVEKLAREAELFKLRQQLQPHFLFNSLNSISALIGTQPEQARKMIHQLSDFLRGTLKKEDQQWVKLSEELEYLQLYLEIEKVRFGHRLSAIIDKDQNCDNLKLPPMLLQPIVENAIKFGLYDTIDDITIRIDARSINNYLEVMVQNPFDPETSVPK